VNRNAFWYFARVDHEFLTCLNQKSKFPKQVLTKKVNLLSRTFFIKSGEPQRFLVHRLCRLDGSPWFFIAYVD
jgi:hypothetical protein